MIYGIQTSLLLRQKRLIWLSFFRGCDAGKEKEQGFEKTVFTAWGAVVQSISFRFC